MSQFLEFATNHWDLFATLFFILGLMAWQAFGGQLRGYRQIEPFEAVKLLNQQDAIIVDVREEKEYQEGHVNGALHLPLGQLRQRLDELAPNRERPIIALCRSGHRSASACSILRKAQFNQVFNLRGGVMAWQNAGLPLERPSKGKKGGKNR